MPRAGRTKLDPDGLYMAWQSFACEDVDFAEFSSGVVRKGHLLRGSHPLVIAHQGFFVAAGDVVDEKVGPEAIQSRREAAGAA